MILNQKSVAWESNIANDFKTALASAFFRKKTQQIILRHKHFLLCPTFFPSGWLVQYFCNSGGCLILKKLLHHLAWLVDCWMFLSIWTNRNRMRIDKNRNVKLNLHNYHCLRHEMGNAKSTNNNISVWDSEPQNCLFRNDNPVVWHVCKQTSKSDHYTCGR